AHVRVGHRQTLNTKNPLRSARGGFFMPEWALAIQVGTAHFTSE
ncbi:hypothetical protein LCGC14_2087930, partial [marine sediment metagenome]